MLAGSTSSSEEEATDEAQLLENTIRGILHDTNNTLHEVQAEISAEAAAKRAVDRAQHRQDMRLLGQHTGPTKQPDGSPDSLRGATERVAKHSRSHLRLARQGRARRKKQVRPAAAGADRRTGRPTVAC